MEQGASYEIRIPVQIQRVYDALRRRDGTSLTSDIGFYVVVVSARAPWPFGQRTALCVVDDFGNLVGVSS